MLRKTDRVTGHGKGAKEKSQSGKQEPCPKTQATAHDEKIKKKKKKTYPLCSVEGKKERLTLSIRWHTPCWDENGRIKKKKRRAVLLNARGLEKRKSWPKEKNKTYKVSSLYTGK